MLMQQAPAPSEPGQDLPRRPAAPAAPPLVVDLDGTLVCSDLLLESALAAVRRNPWTALSLPLWLWQGPAALKQHLAKAGMPDVRTLPYRQELLDCLRQARRDGRTLVLATAADRTVAEAVAAELGLFDRVFASDGRDNCSGPSKRDRLVAAFGESGFDYVGNNRRDLPVWRAARRALVAGTDRRLLRTVTGSAGPERVFRADDGGWRDVLRELRPHQWLKNALVFLPMIAAHQLFSAALLAQATWAFLAFSCCASGVYVLNDLLDLPADRRHPHKRSRPLASGRVPLALGCLLAALLPVAAITIGAWLPHGFVGVLGLYYVITLAYSLQLKDYAVLDVLILAGGYAARVAAGSVAVHIAPSAWLLAFCVFLFFSLALVKRYAELAALRRCGGDKVHARGYFAEDLGVMSAQGIASGYLSVLVLALYTNTAMVQSPRGHYWLYWANCLLLLHWISYLWLMADRGRIEDDPVVFALKDRLSLTLLLAMAAVCVAAA